MTYTTKKTNFIKSLNDNMQLVEDSASSVGFDVSTMREAYIHAFFNDENVTVKKVHNEKLWMCA